MFRLAGKITAAGTETPVLQMLPVDAKLSKEDSVKAVYTHDYSVTVH